VAEKTFMSYAVQDRRLAKSVEKTLRERGLVETERATVLDPRRNVKTRADVRKAIRRQIEEASKVVVIATENGEKSQWVNYEVGLADALGKPILVVKSKEAGVSTAFSKRLNALANVQSVKVK